MLGRQAFSKNQHMNIKIGSILIVSWLVFASCDPGQLLENQLPDTEFFLDEIGLDDSTRLTTIVKVHWIGRDVDGYVSGYELSIDQGEWFFTEETDSTFRFDLPEGNQQADINLRVRAIDNLGDADPEPAELILPVRNTPPTAQFNLKDPIPDTVRSVMTVTWVLEDLEGEVTLDSAFLRINDGPWYPLSASTNFVTIIPSDPKQAGTQNARLLIGGDAADRGDLIAGMVNGGTNRLYLRARDLSRAFSEIDTSTEFFLKPQESDLLIVNAHNNRDAIAFTRNVFNNVRSGDYDWLNIRDEIPSFWEPTFNLYLQLYDQVYWFEDGQITPPGSSNGVFLLEQAANSFQNFLNGGSKLMISAPFNGLFNEAERQAQSLIFDFSPADSLSTSEDDARLAREAPVFGKGIWADLDTLRTTGFVTGVDPFYPKDTSNVLAEATITPTGNWVGPSNVAARSTFTNGRTNQVFFSIEMHRLNGDPDAVIQWFDRVFNQEFNW